MLTDDSERGEASKISIAYLFYQGERSSNWKGKANGFKRALKPKLNENILKTAWCCFTDKDFFQA